MYLGELVRLILVTLVDAAPKPLLFSGKSTPTLNQHYGVDTSLMSATEEAWIGNDKSEDAFALPPLGGEFKKEDLGPKVVIKLEKIRSVIIQHLGLPDDSVSLKDAAVCATYWILFWDEARRFPDCTLD